MNLITAHLLPYGRWKNLGNEGLWHALNTLALVPFSLRRLSQAVSTPSVKLGYLSDKRTAPQVVSKPTEKGGLHIQGSVFIILMKENVQEIQLTLYQLFP